MSEETAAAESLTPEEGFQAVLEGRDRDPSVAEETTEAAADSEVSEEATEEVAEITGLNQRQVEIIKGDIQTRIAQATNLSKEDISPVFVKIMYFF